MLSFQDRTTIRDRYLLSFEKIKKYYPGFDPYQIHDWVTTMTPIEVNVWSDIRHLGLPMLPEYPVLNYFLDFADPIKQIGIEVDGARWHRDRKKDLQRQSEIEMAGWTIYRLPGNVTFKQIEDYLPEGWEDEFDSEDVSVEREKRLKKYYSECSEGILRKIKQDNY